MLELNKIYCGNHLKILKDVDNNSIDLTLTSPPYDNLRTYNGYEFQFEKLANELFRVTKKGGVVVWVVGDATLNGSETGTSFKQALYFREIGFNLHDTMIYRKNNFIPLNHKRYEQVFEFMFVFAKGKPEKFNPITVHSLTAGGKKDWGNLGITKNLEGSNKLKRKNEITTTNEYRIKDNIWDYNVGQGQSSKDKVAFEHTAIFPEKLARDHIISWSNKGDLILDPMNGSGTTTKVAELLERDFIGIDSSQDYCDIAEKRLQQETIFK